MTSTGHRSRISASRLPTGDRRSTTHIVIRSLLLGATVFALAALAGALLSGAAPAVLTTDLVGSPPATTAPPAAGEPAPPATGPVYHSFAVSMIWSGAAALAVSVTGMMIVGRRRRQW